MQILGIDDNEDITELLDTVLNGSGHEYTFVNDGKSGLEKIRENQYDVCSFSKYDEIKEKITRASSLLGTSE